MNSDSKKKSKYHHGDLRRSLITNATRLVEQESVDGLSMRKLGESVGVSRTALYHHFSNKNDLLSAVAEQGFEDWQNATKQALAIDEDEFVDVILNYFISYFDFALNNPAIYELMFGKTIWLELSSSESLHQTAYNSFQYHLDIISEWQSSNKVNTDIPPLRLAQLTWGTLHGICRFFMDGIYVDKKHLIELAGGLVQLLIKE